MEENNNRLAVELARLDAEIEALESQPDAAEPEIVSRIIFRVNHIIDEEIGQVDAG